MRIEPVSQSSLNTNFQGLLESILKGVDKLPDNALPKDTEGPAIDNAHLLPPITLYNSHGILKKTPQNSLLAYA